MTIHSYIVVQITFIYTNTYLLIRTGMPKFHSSRPNGSAIIKKEIYTTIHTSIHTHLGPAELIR